jgi:diguanylate cyclase (GGDEF)-like protein
MDDRGRDDGRPLHVRVARAFDGPEINQGEEREAASTARAVLVFSLAATMGYLSFYLIRDAAGLRSAILTDGGFALVYVVGLFLLHRGRVLAAAVIGSGAIIPQILACTSLLGSQVGLHVFLIAIGPAVFMIFTDAQSAFRWLFSLTGAAVFVYCQFALQPTSAALSLSPASARFIFSLNAGAAGLLVAVLAAVEHSRRRVSAAGAHLATSRAQFLANTDALTGLANRRPVMDELERISAEGDYCVVVADLDNFKELNDRFGHLCGDHVLAGIGTELLHHVRAFDTVGRWGGEEFIFVLPGTSLGDATGFAERLRTAIEACSFACGDHVHRVTASFGIADGTGDGMSHRVVRRADDAMYEAKEAGRNAVRREPLSSVVPEPPTRGIPVVHRPRTGAKDSL